MSIKVNNLYKLNTKNNNDIYSLLFQTKQLYNELLIKRTLEILLKEFSLFKKWYFKEKNIEKEFDTNKQYINYMYRTLSKEVLSNTGIWSLDDWFCDYINDYKVDLLLLKDNNDYYIQLFASNWAINQLKTLLNLTNNFSYTDQTDYPGTEEKELKHKNLIDRLYSHGYSFADNGLIINISDSVPNNNEMIEKLSELKEEDICQKR